MNGQAAAPCPMAGVVVLVALTLAPVGRYHGTAAAGRPALVIVPS